jgi:hypothetical protein
MAYQRQGSIGEVTKDGYGDITKALQQFLPSIGLGNFNDYYRAPSSIGEGQTDGGYLDPALMQKLDEAGYTFGRTGGINQDNFWDVMQNGNVVNRYQTGSSSGLDGFMAGGGALLPALGGMALFGTGGVGAGTGLLGGSGGAAAGSGAAATTGGVSNGAIMGGGLGATTAAAGPAAAGTGLGGLLSGIGGAKTLAGGLGALAGLSGAGDQKQTSTQKMDPRMDAMLYGQGGFLPQLQQWFQQNQQPNQLMQQGAQQQANFYNSPQYTQGFSALRDTGMGLLGKGVAKNPFLEG